MGLLDCYKITLFLLIIYECLDVVHLDEISTDYLATLKSMKSCEKVELPYQNGTDRIVHFEHEIYHKDHRPLIRGKLTVLGDTSVLMGRVRLYSLSDNNRVLRLQLANLTCHSPLVFLGMKVLREINVDLRFNRKTCAVPKKTYYFDGMDIDRVDHLLPAWHTYGTLIWQAAATTKTHTVFCQEVNIEITPL